MRKQSVFQFYASLRDLLPEKPERGIVKYAFNGSPSVKDAMEALGVPHTEVAYINCNDSPVDFTFQLKGRETISIFPYHYRQTVHEKPLVPLMPPGRPSFIADIHLGKLARFMRVAGFDTLYEQKDMGDEKIAAIAAAEKRIVLTRDAGLLKRSAINYGYIPRSVDSRKQFREVTQRYRLKSLFIPFSRCVHCNGLITKIDKKKVERELPEGIKRNFDEIFICLNCRHLYWQGSHYKRINDMLERI